jgi:coatomer subunit beta
MKTEKGKPAQKIEALKKTITMLLKGEKMPSLLMVGEGACIFEGSAPLSSAPCLLTARHRVCLQTIIRFVMPVDDHTIKKLLLLYWEIVPKRSDDGKLLHEMILVCDAYRRDLQHPNEFIRGSTLRFLCKLKEPELLEPLMPSIQDCLTHRHPYVSIHVPLFTRTLVLMS